MTTGQLIEVLRNYPDTSEVYVSDSQSDNEVRTLIGVRKGKVIDVKTIQNKRGKGVYYVDAHLELPTVAVLLA